MSPIIILIIKISYLLIQVSEYGIHFNSSVTLMMKEQWVKIFNHWLEQTALFQKRSTVLLATVYKQIEARKLHCDADEVLSLWLINYHYCFH